MLYHQGSANSITVAPVDPLDLVSRNELTEMNARKKFYQEQTSNTKKLALCKKLGQKGIPSIITIFCIIYWYSNLTWADGM